MIYLLALVPLLALVGHSNALCETVDSCSCRDSVSGVFLSLGPLAHRDKTPALHFADSQGNYDFLYNPCLPFTSVDGAGTECDSVALCQEGTHGGQRTFFNLGNQSTAAFIENDSKQYIQYRGHKTVTGKERVTWVELICDEAAEDPVFEYSGEPVTAEYYFTLRSKCACLGKCQRIAQTCLPTDSGNCSCRLSDGDLVNIKSLDQPSSPLVVKTPTAIIRLNPCTGINVGTDTQCRDVTVCLEESGSYVDYGVSSSAQYSVQDGFVTLSYISRDRTRRTTIQLVCDAAQRHYPQVSMIGEPTSSQLNLELRSVCACPNGCFNPQVGCQRLDDCSCRLNDGSGTVSLHPIDKPEAPLEYSLTDQYHVTFHYYYNPCSKFTVEDTQNCTDVAACQTIPQNKDNFNIGRQEDVTFRVSDEAKDVVSLNYVHGDEDRQSIVQLQCNSSAESPSFKFVEESPSKTYHFVLESKDACVTP